jgi:hypothetical protein
VSDKDKFEGTITGTVERVRQYAKGDVVTVAYLAKPSNQYPSRVTVWCDGSAPVGEGQRVTVTGQVSVSVEEYNGKHRAQVSVNFPTWGEVEPAAAPAVASGDGGWGLPGSINDETPF